MARDYARKGNKRGGSRGASGGGRKPIPGWLWLVTGLTVGLFVAFLVFLSQHERSDTRAAVAANGKASAKAAAENQKKAGAVAASPTQPPEAKTPERKPMNYDFYTKLEEFEVEVADDKKAGRPRPVAAPGSYVLQAGSFRAARDADSRKAELALLGIRASVQTVTVDGNATFHRVRIGPYRDLDRINQVRQTLRDNHIDFVTLKERS